VNRGAEVTAAARIRAEIVRAWSTWVNYAANRDLARAPITI
jgi:hypothetical protein